MLYLKVSKMSLILQFHVRLASIEMRRWRLVSSVQIITTVKWRDLQVVLSVQREQNTMRIAQHVVCLLMTVY